MEAADVKLDAGSASYEIHLQGTPSEALAARFAFTRVRRRPAQTVLMGQVASQDELARLLERVLAMGLVLNEVHELRVGTKRRHPSPSEPGRRTTFRAYEVRIDGQLDNALLRFLQWHHRHLPEHAAVWLEGTPEHVYAFLSDCCRHGLGIERVRRVKALDAVGA